MQYGKVCALGLALWYDLWSISIQNLHDQLCMLHADFCVLTFWCTSRLWECFYVVWV